jgi:sulfur-carrier protein
VAVSVHVPAQLRHLSGGQSVVEVEGDTVATAVGSIEGVRHRVLDDQGRVRIHVNLFVNGSHIRQLDGLDTKVGDGDEIVILPSVSGG